jgi:hypothetical protein
MLRGFLTACRVERAGSAPIDKGRAVGAGTLCKKLQAASAVEEAALGQGAVSAVIAKSGKILSGEPSSVVDDQRMHVAVGRVVIVDRRDKLDGVP